jgi:hypothetical protein
MLGDVLLFILGEKIKLVNVDSASLRILSVLIKKHFAVLKEGWDRQGATAHAQQLVPY